MNHWKTTLDLSDILADYENEEITLQVLAEKTAACLRLNLFSHDNELQDIIADFKNLSEEIDIADDDYDDIMVDLYDYGDQGNRIWIKMSDPKTNERNPGEKLKIVVRPHDKIKKGYCKKCSILHHDSCSMTPGCPCCDNTAESIRQDHHQA